MLVVRLKRKLKICKNKFTLPSLTLSSISFYYCVGFELFDGSLASPWNNKIFLTTFVFVMCFICCI